MHIWGTHLLLFCTYPMQPRGNKVNTLFSPYVLLKRGLFDLKLIGQAWALGLKARTAGLFYFSTRNGWSRWGVLLLFAPCIHLSIPRVQSIPLHLYPCFAAPIFYLSQPVSFRKLGRAQFRVWWTVHGDANGCYSRKTKRRRLLLFMRTCRLLHAELSPASTSFTGPL